MNTILASLNAIVDQVDTGQDALALAVRYDYDIVILDLMLPDMEGFDVVRRMRAARDETPIKIIDVFICKLRKKIAAAGVDNLIGTAWGRGYVIREQTSGREATALAAPAPAVAPPVRRLEAIPA